jgi:hypothetical protein
MLKPSGSIHWRRTKPPGWVDSSSAWLVLLQCQSARQSFRGQASMIIEIIYVERIAVGETKDQSPVGPDSDRPRAFHFALERM